MWIRTECGMLLNNDESTEIRQNEYGKKVEVLNYKVSENRYVVLPKDKNETFTMIKYSWNNDVKTIYDTAKIKKQGDNLIDVLSWGDIVMYRDGSTEFMKSVNDYNKIKLLRHNVVKVITVEQYMPLAQEVK